MYAVCSKADTCSDSLTYEEAIDAFEQIAAAGIRNGNLFYNLGNAYLKKDALRRICYTLGFLSVLALGTAGWRMVEKTCCRNAVILPASVAVRSGFAPESTALFVLHEGTKVRVEKQTENFKKIRFLEHKIGWIGREAAGGL